MFPRRILYNAAIVERDAAFRSFCYIGIVCNHDDCGSLLMEFLEQRHDLVAGAAIKGARRLIGQDKRWLIYQRPSDGNALLLATGELIWPMVSAMAQADALQSLCRRSESRHRLRAK